MKEYEFEVKKVDPVPNEPGYDPYECIICNPPEPAAWRVTIGVIELPGGEEYDLCEFHKRDLDVLFELYADHLEGMKEAEEERKFDTKKEQGLL